MPSINLSCSSLVLFLKLDGRSRGEDNEGTFSSSHAAASMYL